MFFREAGVPAINDGPAPAVDAAEVSRTAIAGKRYGLRVIDWGDGRRVNHEVYAQEKCPVNHRPILVVFL